MGFQLFNVTGEAGSLPQLFVVLAFTDEVLEEREVERPVRSAAHPSTQLLPLPFLCPDGRLEGSLELAHTDAPLNGLDSAFLDHGHLLRTRRSPDFPSCGLDR